MNTKEGNHPSPVKPEKKIHQTHFPVVKTPLEDDHDSGYEWVYSGPGRWKRVPKKS